MTDKPVVLVTGFGLFRDYARNSSQLVVEELSKHGVPFSCDLRTEIIPVEYECVANTVPELWKKHKPDVVIHCGMSHLAKAVTIERQARLNGYCSPDTKGCTPPDNKCSNGCEFLLKTGIDVDAVCSAVNDSKTKEACGATVSEDAGNYLCEFIYYCSLNISRKAVFIHIPSLDHSEEFTLDDLVKATTAAIKEIVEQVKKEKCAKSS